MVDKRGALVLACALLFLAQTANSKEGFGVMTKETASLTRINPPLVHLAGTRIAVKGTSQSKQDSGIASRIANALQNAMLGNDPRLKLSSTNPETVVDIIVLASQIDKKWEVREELELFKEKDSKGKKHVRTRTVLKRYIVTSQVVSVSFNARNLTTGETLHADTIEGRFTEEYENGEGVPEDAGLESNAVAFVVGEIAPRLTRTTEEIEVLLPKGSLADYIPLARAGLWNKYLEAVERVPPKDKPSKESYREYAIGLAHEAIGYGSDDPETALLYLEEASVHYNEALYLNAEEKFFAQAYERNFLTEMIVGAKTAQPPINRVNAALKQYQQLLEYTALAPESYESGGDKAVGVSHALTNALVIEMVVAGLSDDIILTAIQDAETTSFDVSPRGLIELTQAKVSQVLIKHIQKEVKAK